MTGIDFIQDLAVVMAAAGLVGWLFQRLGMSLFAGYIVAGMLIGPHTLPVPLIQESDRISVLAQLGLVFLMFSIGLGTNLRRLRQLGLGVVLATAGSAFLLFNGWRLFGHLIGLDNTASLFLAGMLLASSSTIIGKLLQERGQSHRRFGRLAQGVTVIEDMLAIIALTLLLSYAGIEGAAPGGFWETTGLFGVLVVFTGISGLLLVPRLLKVLSRQAVELPTLAVTALLLALAILAHLAGFSLALGAFLTGVIIAETTQRQNLERVFEGMRHIFTAVFFVIIGLLIEPHMVAEVWWLIVPVALLVIASRILILPASLILIGHPPRDAFRTGMLLTPVGEFAFIISQAGIAATAAPPGFFPLAAGVALITCLVSPFLSARADRIADAVERWQPRPLLRLVVLYHGWLTRVGRRQDHNLFWRFSRKRLVQIAVGILFITGLLIVAVPMQNALANLVGDDWFFRNGTVVLVWIAIGFVALIPLIAVWRNIAALALIYANMTSRRSGRDSALPFLVENGFKFMAACGLALWLGAFLPLGGGALWLLAAVLAVLGLILFFFRKRLIFLHARFEGELGSMLAEKETPSDADTIPAWLSDPGDWHLRVVDCVLPEGASAAGKSIGELALRKRFSCSIMAIDRHGFVMPNPPAAARLYPRDRLLLLGTEEATETARIFLDQTLTQGEDRIDLDEVSLETLAVPADSPRVNRTFAELALNGRTGILVAGIRRPDGIKLNPSGADILRAGDKLLVLGTPSQIHGFEDWLHPEPVESTEQPHSTG